jgi:DNA (cytosine-5)-methyltransferase 1
VWGDDWEPVLFCEMDKYCQKVLNKHWPEVPIVEDVRDVTTNARRERILQQGQSANAEKSGKESKGVRQDGIQKEQNKEGRNLERTIDLITGGFPCQPFSNAGKRDGRSDDRYLWPEMLRVIRDFKPAWVIAENVRGILNIEEGVVFEQVCTDLEDAGYEVQPFVIPAVATDAYHRRDRVWFCANLADPKLRGCVHGKPQEQPAEAREQAQRQSESGGEYAGDVADSDNKGLQRVKEYSAIDSKGAQPKNEHARGGNRRGRCEWIAEPNVGRVANGVPDRVDRLKCLGNAIVPQVAEMIMRSIKDSHVCKTET